MRKSILCAILGSAVLVGAASAKPIGDIGIYIAHVGWIGAGTAQAGADAIVKNQKLAPSAEIVAAKDIQGWVEKRSGNGKVNVIITFGGFPGSLYKSGNAQPDGSLAEKWLDDGNMFLNTADYIFYYSDGVQNGDVGLKSITDSNFDQWTDGNANKPTKDGAKYTPSLKAFSAPRSFKKSQIDNDKNWEIEVILADNGADFLDPVVIKHTKTGGRVAIAIQVSDDGQPRGAVLTEMLNNWLKEAVTPEAVQPQGKASVAWGQIKTSVR
ncbi:hypothetical protein FJZ36_04660 [Candidatus Poribacteria bacterium]|nr:hypothetical protein [Candidatus Poribacteria bacterium]